MEGKDIMINELDMKKLTRESQRDIDEINKLEMQV